MLFFSPPCSILHRKGFNLIEAAIVLAVIGLVIGGIWVAASTVMAKNQNQQIVTGLTYALSRITSLIPRSIADGQLQDYDGAPHTAVDMKLFPEDWIRGDKIVAPNGANIRVFVQDGGCLAGPGAGRSAYIYLDSVTKDQCINLAMAMVPRVKNLLMSFSTGSHAYNTDASTWRLSWISSACASGYVCMSLPLERNN